MYTIIEVYSTLLLKRTIKYVYFALYSDIPYRSIKDSKISNC